MSKFFILTNTINVLPFRVLFAILILFTRHVQGGPRENEKNHFYHCFIASSDCAHRRFNKSRYT